MKKVVKIIAIILALSCLCCCSATGLNSASVKKQALNYLCEKYDAEEDEFELVDYNRPHIYWKEHYIFFQKPVWINPSFEFRYNGRLFIVSKMNNEFYDDYQLEDVETWCTEWCQINVDERIIGIDLSTNDILNYQLTQNDKYFYIISKSDSKKLLINYMDKTTFPVFCYKDTQDSNSHSINEELSKSIKETLNSQSDCSSVQIDVPLVIETEKLAEDSWYRHTESENKTN